MKFTALALALVPALALADDGAAHGPAAATSTGMATAKMIKTVMLARVHHTTSTLAQTTTTALNTTTTVMHSNTTTALDSSMTSSTTSDLTSLFTPPGTTTDAAPAPTTSKKADDDSAAGALDATNVAFAGVLGMLAVALM
ncbi:hypothetical protein E4U41_006986 [Claviceps citrina]|nr:hypothetical protein E4U41_006986 [Claviceps citrina]